MFESSLLTKLTADTELISYLSTFTISGSTTPAIFANHAPEKAEFPYLVFKISQSSSNCLAVKEFNIFIDYYDKDDSESNSRKAVHRIEFLLDRAVLEHERYSYIRLFFFDGDSVEEDDPRAIHYNLQFSARAGRKKWIDEHFETTTTTSGS